MLGGGQLEFCGWVGGAWPRVALYPPSKHPGQPGLGKALGRLALTGPRSHPSSPPAAVLARMDYNAAGHAGVDHVVPDRSY